MTARAEKIEEHGWPLVVEPTTLRTLISEMQQLVGDPGNIELTVYFSDGLRQGFTNGEDVIALENPGWRCVTGLIVVAEGRSAMLSCQFGPGWTDPRARVRVVGEDPQWVYESCRRLRERIKSMSRSLPPAVYVTRRLGIFAVVMFVALAAFFLTMSRLSNIPLPLGFLMPSIIVCGLGAYAAVCYYLFHPLVFCIGQGARRYELVVKWRWAVGTIVVGTIVIGGFALPVIRRWLGIS